MLRGNSIHIYHIYSPIVIDLGVVQGVSYWNGSLKRLKKWPDISVSDDVRQILKINPVISGFVSNLNLIRKIASQSKFCKLVCHCHAKVSFDTIQVPSYLEMPNYWPWRASLETDIFSGGVVHCTAHGAFWYHIIRFLDGAH